MDQRDQGPAALPRTRRSRTCPPTSVSTTCGYPRCREAQAELARDHGVTGFCYWHYWFGGRRLLERPFEEVLACGRPDFPFCVCLGQPVLVGDLARGARTDPDRADLSGPRRRPAHFEYLLRAFEDDRYITVAGGRCCSSTSLAISPTRLDSSSVGSDGGEGGLRRPLPGGRIGESDYLTHHEDGFDAAVYYQFPFAITFVAGAATVDGAWGMQGTAPIPLHRASSRSPSDHPRSGVPLRLPQLGQHAPVGTAGVGRHRSDPERFGARSRALELAIRTRRRRAGPDDQVVERVGRGKLPRTRLRDRPRRASRCLGRGRADTNTPRPPGDARGHSMRSLLRFGVLPRTSRRVT